MNSEIIESFFIANGELITVKEADKFSAGTSRTIYEVIRVVSEVPVFLERHIERLESSAKLVGSSIEAIKLQLEAAIHELIKANKSPEKNIKIIVYNLENDTPDYLAYFIKSSYPSAEEYRKGVKAILIKEERSNPNAKVINSSYKERVAAAMESAGAYEALLVNSRDEITEGSRSNIFFVRDGEILTAPKGNVLIGITRVCVVELCETLGIKVLETPVGISMLKELDGVFMTGTSPKILPIHSIGELQFASAENPVIQEVMKGYNDLLDKYVRSKTNGQA